ncbi:MAG: ornithine cyclodeaminase family protein [Clostridiales bacterium]|nr:ornithine cyclodeaminase family protein [Clostridiales bacterium]
MAWPDHLLYLPEAELRRYLPPSEAVKAAGEAYRALVEGRVESPLRQALSPRDDLGTWLIMPARGDRHAAVKLVTLSEGNARRGLPTIVSVVLLLDAVTGVPLAAMDGTALTRIRTGAAAGIATQVLSRPDASVMALIGTGGQAWDQFLSVAAVRDLKEVRVYSRTPSHVEAFVKTAQALRPGIRWTAAKSAEEAVHGAHIITCVTTSATPVFPPEAVSPGAHINGVGSYRRDMVELPPELLRERVFVETEEIALEESGEIAQALARGHLTKEGLIPLGKVLLGRAEGRRSPDEITVFKTAGTAALDLYAARRAWEGRMRGETPWDGGDSGFGGA